MYIVVEATDMTRTMRFITLTAHIDFDPHYEQHHRGGVERRMEGLEEKLIEVVKQHYPEVTSEVLTDIEYGARRGAME